jgi:two-component system chemotaxis response regulator CheY
MGFDDMNILVLDDNSNMRRLICTILRTIGVAAIKEAASAEAAYQLLDSWRPDVMLVDYRLKTHVTGADFTRAVRTTYDVAGQPIPIVIVSGHSDVESIQEVADAGANGFVAKPFTAKTLAAHLFRAANDPRTLADLLQNRGIGQKVMHG